MELATQLLLSAHADHAALVIFISQFLRFLSRRDLDHLVHLGREESVLALARVRHAGHFSGDALRKREQRREADGREADGREADGREAESMKKWEEGERG